MVLFLDVDCGSVPESSLSCTFLFKLFFFFFVSTHLVFQYNCNDRI